MTTVDRQTVLEIRDPADDSLVGSVKAATPEGVETAIATAKRQAPGWAATPAAGRGVALKDAARSLRARAAEIAVLIESETGKPRAEAEEGVLAGAGTLEQYAELGPVHRGRSLLGDPSATDLMVPEPRGVVVVLTPWNDPVAVACGLLGAAVVMGNTVVHKPSERCPHTGAWLGNVLSEALPEGVLQTVQGDGSVGAELAAHADVDVIAHVGGTAAGRSIAASAAKTGAKVLLENGGNDPLVVDAGVDPVWAAEQAATGAFANSGQICVSVERIHVHQDIADAFLTALAAEAGHRELAPLVDRRHREGVHAQVAEAIAQGADPLVGGIVPDGPGAFYPATVLTGCTSEMRVLTEETFGPVAPVTVAANFDQALAQAAAGEYGLAATVLTSSMAHAQRAWRELPVGTVKINSVFGGAPGGAAHPRGASGSGYGYGPELLGEMTQTKVVHLAIPGP
ncbi:aldehyde dehydrogenase family protein [Amycolatopsis decaplanina]|uniref:Succinate-semialdehyde dehydrogenase (NADP+) n=1 Tax=Amycolatopsis decaplanina DSM 44594 TaxID=1284240 RepID=M2YGI2_9PSEU|nr:aldehyde dehydrogenase family protein [Amycolatopsis decaplanina]EME60830.1 succinate-semialdehyde dehydrogenase (NADP+) [Amycolatopsis decaplanina DSM 44594]